MKNICVVGVGYVGLVTGTCFADLGNTVIGIDVNQEKINDLKNGVMPIYEPGLAEMVTRNVKAGRLNFTTSYKEALKDADFAFICVGTPEGVDGEADLRYVRAAAEEIALHMDHPMIIINKSTVPVGTGDWVADIVRSKQPKPIEFSVVSCPEFLREGAALSDFMNPDRTVLGSTDQKASEAVAQLFLPLRKPIMMTDLRTAEMIKYASNAFLATRISFINEISIICERLGADVMEVAQGMGFDKRIGHHFLQAGVGYGGSCFTPEETIFALDGDNIVPKTLETLFQEAGEPIQGDVVEFVQPHGKQVLGFNRQTGCPELVDINVVTRRPYTGTMVNIKTSMGRSLKVTADHPVLMHTDDGFNIIPAFDVQKGDQLMALMELPPLTSVHAFNLIDLLRGTPLEADVYVSPTDNSFSEQYSQYANHVPTEMLRYPHEVKQNNRMSLRLYRHLSELNVLNVLPENLQLYTAKGAATKINAIIPVDADLLRLTGYYVAEGCIATDFGRAGAQRERIMFSFHEDEREYIEDTQRILSRYGMKFIEQHSTSSINILVSSRVFAWFVRDVLGCGINSNNKQLPSIAFNVSPELRFEFLRGAFSGDGAVSFVQNGKNITLEYATTSKLLADGMSLLIQSMGVVCSICQRMMNKSKHVAYILRVSGYEQLRAFSRIFGEKRYSRINNALAGYQRVIKQRGFDRQGVYSTLRVQETEHSATKQLVYSLETSTGIIVVSSGLVMKQCFPKDVKALAYMAQTHGMHPQLLNAVMEINDFMRKHVIFKLQDMLGDVKGKRVGLLGLAFKENTDDIRESPALTIGQFLLERGASVPAFDPVAMDHSARALPGLIMCKDSYEVAANADALVVVTPWNEFKQLDMAAIRKSMKTPILIDGRNMYEPSVMHKLGFSYSGVGRGYNGKGEK
jgi:UDPglucose 6-dehydrogenase